MSAPTHATDLDLLERVRARLLRPFHVIIHDDPIHTYRDVALAVQHTVPGKSYEDGWEIATLVDTTGEGIAATCPKEQAEYYRERFEQTYGLTSTIEPA
ncbi:MAG TPA: ATP-dependent Clp protease adaptor ClpS [Chloroflexota bacterium]|nr:ATP-dependent Clp protease adaptor ClpS [Chloroflexota bacterium]